MNNERLKFLNEYVKAGVFPILLEDISANAIQGGVVLPANCDVSLLSGHYEDVHYMPPQWYSEVLHQAVPLLVIDCINQIPKEEQRKFLEILKYKKISTFELPPNCMIFVTCSNLKEHPIDEDIYSLMVHI